MSQNSNALDFGSQNITGPGSESTRYLREIPAGDAVVDIGRPSKRYRKAHLQELDFQTNSTPTTPPAGGIVLYDSGSKLYYRDSTATNYQLATTVDTGAFLPLDGSGTMSGDVKMGGHELANVAAIRTTTPNIIYGQTAAIIGSATNAIIMGHAASVTGSAIISPTVIGYNASCQGNFGTALGAGAGIGTGTQNTAVGNNSTIPGVLTNCTILGCQAQAINASDSSTVVGATSYTLNADQAFVVGANNASQATGANILGYNLVNTTAHSTIFGDDSHVNLRPASTTCDLGTTALPFKDVILNGSVRGSTNSRTADNIMSNSGGSSNGNLVSFSGTTGKVATDSGVVASNVVTNTGTAAAGNLAAFSSNKVVQDSLLSAGSIVIGPSSATNGAVAVYSGTTGKLLADGVPLSSLLTTAAAIATYAALAGATFTGVISSTNATASTTPGSGALIVVGGVGVGGAINAAGVVTAGDFVATTPSCASAFSSGGGAPSFTSGTGKLLAFTFVQSLAPANWTLTTASGLYTYNGATTQYFNVRIDFTMKQIATASSIQLWVTKNGSLTPTDQILWEFSATSLAINLPGSVGRVLQMATNDTVQFAGLLTGTSTNVTFADIKILITPVG
jgi:hypothetical protein